MRALEHRIPPPIVVLLAALLMWAVARALPATRFELPGHTMVAILIAVLGGLFDLAGLIEFRRAQTTVNPLAPRSASSLVTTGVYSRSRNPMYLGLLVILVGWAVFLASPLSLVVLPLFVVYINRFQIEPEERALQALFGSDFDAYRSRVRRWL